MPQPRPNAKKGIITIPAFVRKAFMSGSKLPNNTPTTNGNITPTSVINGIDARPGSFLMQSLSEMDHLLSKEWQLPQLLLWCQTQQLKQCIIHHWCST